MSERPAWVIMKLEPGNVADQRRDLANKLKGVYLVSERHEITTIGGAVRALTVAVLRNDDVDAVHGIADVIDKNFAAFFDGQYAGEDARAAR